MLELKSILLIFGFIRLLNAQQEQYDLVDDYRPEDFAEKFTFHEKQTVEEDYSRYLGREEAERTGLYKVQNNRLYMGVDYENVTESLNVGRNAVRIESKKQYTYGLFLLDLAHMPENVCGTWPAYWLTGPEWPKSGEMDIIEGVNTQNFNLMTLHTNQNCTIQRSNFTGILQTPDCDINSPRQMPNQGCSISADRLSSYGKKFNEVGGGVYALEWTSDFIQIWLFERREVPEDVKRGNPTPSKWPLPVARYTNDKCDIDAHFKNQTIIFNINFCGSWAEGRWLFECLGTKAICRNFVRENPQKFRDVYWEINWLQIYESRRKNRTKN